MRDYFRPLVRSDLPRPDDALPLAGGPRWFTHVARHRRDGSVARLPASDLPEDVAARLSARRAPLLGMPLDEPRIGPAPQEQLDLDGAYTDYGVVCFYSSCLLHLTCS